MNLKILKKIHFIGIGGIGVSAVARMMLGEGKLVVGSNLGESKITQELKKLGAIIYIEHNENNLDDDTDLVIYSPAITKGNSELQKAKKLNIPVISYPQSLGLISKDKFTIAVSGTHGKTTTTAMLAEIFIDAQLDPTVIVGSLFKKQKTNFLNGKSEYFIVEACEYKRSFLQLQPNILVITNIDEDHLDYYKDMADIQSAFKELALKMSEKDFIVCDPDNPTIIPVLSGIRAKIVDYRQYKSDNLNLKIPGKHNIQNALVGLAIADILNLNKEETEKSLNNFEGTWRRFECKGKTKNGTLIYDDYAHNPTEVRATLQGAKEFFKDKKITIIFQPHLYSRTKIFLEDFAESFDDIDRVIILPIYAAREKNDPSINSEILVEKIKKFNQNVSYSEFENISEKIDLESFGSGDVIFTIGAGDVYKIGETLLAV